MMWYKTPNTLEIMAHEVLKDLIVLVIDSTEIKNSFLKNNFHASLALVKKDTSH